MNSKIEKIIYWGIAASLLIPLIVTNSFLFPFQFGKQMFFFGLMILMALLLAASLLRGNFYKWSGHRLFYVFSGYIAVLFATSLFGVDFQKSFFGNFERGGGLIYYFFSLIFFLILLFYWRKDEIWEKTLKYLFIINIAVDLLAVCQAFGIGILFKADPGRAFGTLGNPTFLGSYLVISLIFNFYGLLQYKKLKFLAYSAIFINLLTIFLSGTRGAIFSVLLIFLAFLITIFFKKDFLPLKLKMACASAFFLIILSAGGLYFLRNEAYVKNNPIFGRLTTAFSAKILQENRFKMWNYAFDAFKEKPILGYGQENYNYAFNSVFDSKMSEKWWDRSHNNYLDILVMSGLIGLFFYFILIVSAYFTIFKLYRNSKVDYPIYLVLFFGFSAYLIQNIFIFDTISSFLAFILFLALLAYLENKNNEGYNKLSKEGFAINANLRDGLMVFLFIFSLYISFIIIIKPVLASYHASLGMDFKDNSENFQKEFKKALSYNSYGQKEILYALCTVVEEQLKKDNNQNLNFAIASLGEENMQKDLRLGLFLAGFYNSKALENNEFAKKSNEIIESLRKNHPNRQEFNYQLGKNYILLGEYKSALANFEEAVQLNKEFDSLWNLLVINMQIGNLGETKRIYKEIIELSSDLLDENSLKELYNAYINSEDWAGARDVMIFLISKDENNSDLYLKLASIYNKLKDEKSAQEALNKALSLNPGLEKELLKKSLPRE